MIKVKTNYSDPSRIAAGKEYGVVCTRKDSMFHIINDSGRKILCRWEFCAHIGCGDWQIVGGE